MILCFVSTDMKREIVERAKAGPGVCVCVCVNLDKCNLLHSYATFTILHTALSF